MKAWLCICRDEAGRLDVTQWITQDGADQMACEEESLAKRVGRRLVCVVVPEDAAPDAALQAAAVAEILIETDDEP